MVRDTLTRSAGLSLDQVLFDANPRDDVWPAGLRNGVPAITASTSDNSFDTMVTDLALLAVQVAQVGGSRDCR
jgi:hypothetical protein